MFASIGILELSSIAAGYNVQDTVVKAATVKILIARTICPGKYIVVIGGKTEAVKTAMKAGENASLGFLADKLLIPNVDKRVIPALSGCVELPENYHKALGIIETFSASSIIRAADAAVKSANIDLYRVHIAMAIGGKGYLLLCGDTGSVQAAVNAGIECIKDEGMLLNKQVIFGVSKDLFKEYI